MKKIMAVLSLCSVFAMALAFAGCSGEQTFEAKNWESGDTVVKSVSIDVEDRAVEVIPSEDGQVHIEYSESEKEYSLSLPACFPSLSCMKTISLLQSPAKPLSAQLSAGKFHYWSCQWDYFQSTQALYRAMSRCCAISFWEFYKRASAPFSQR